MALADTTTLDVVHFAGPFVQKSANILLTDTLDTVHFAGPYWGDAPADDAPGLAIIIFIGV